MSSDKSTLDALRIDRPAMGARRSSPWLIVFLVLLLLGGATALLLLRRRGA